ncbi:GNAT family N-acetyltransferase [Halomonas huangheensis]|nr:GNAT family N-acetyltransferase [Halomonas huangheensis]ALM54631.1 GCN5 family acetyltransferase [Halomonas huangheensis]
MWLIETERIQLRRFLDQDLVDLTTILSDPEVMRFSIRGICDQKATRSFIEGCLASYSEYGFGPLAIVDKGAGDLVGFCGICYEMVDECREVSLGYRLARRYWNQGLATEANSAALEHAFTQLGVESIITLIQPENPASWKVAEKIGFCDYTEMTFHERHVRCYRITREQWLQSSE